MCFKNISFPKNSVSTTGVFEGSLFQTEECNSSGNIIIVTVIKSAPSNKTWIKKKKKRYKFSYISSIES